MTVYKRNLHVRTASDNKSAAVLCLAALAGGLMASVWCGETFAQPRPHERVECVSDIYPPYVVEQAGAVAGIDTDLLVAAGRVVGLEIIPKILPWARVEAEIKRGADSTVGCAFAFSRTAEREAYMQFATVPLKVTSFTLFARPPRSSQVYSGAEGLKGARIGVRHAFRVPDAIKDAASRDELTLDSATDDELNFRKLVLGRVDYVLTNQDVGVTMIRRLDLSDVKAVRPAVVELPTFVVFNRGYARAAEWQKAIDRGLTFVRGNHTEQRIRDNYLR